MKKLFLLALLLVALAAFAACEEEATQTGNEIPGDGRTANNVGGGLDGALSSAEAFSLPLMTRSDFTILMNMDIKNVVDAIGEPNQIFTAPSCAFDGEDRIFLFPGMQLHTWPDGGVDRVHTINIRDDSRRTAGGILLGDSYADLIAAYGDGYTREFDMITFTRGRTTMSFFMDGDTIASILFELLLQ